MRIAFCSPEYVMHENVDGGLANYLKKTAYALSNKEIEVWVFVYSNRNALWHDGKGIIICEIDRRIAVFNWLAKVPKVGKYYRYIKQILLSKKLAKQFWKHHKQHPFDIIQSSSYATPGFSLLNNGKVPLVCRISSYTPMVRSSYGRRRNVPDYLMDYLELRQIIDSNGSFAPSEFVANVIYRIEGLKPDVIGTPIDEKNIEFDECIFSQKAPLSRYLLFFGTLSKIKGIDIIAEVLNPIMRTYQDIYFLFIGRDDCMPNGDKCKDYIFSKCDFRERLIYLPALPKPQLYPFIQNTEAVIMPSRVDNYPNACIEAISLGVPVIGTKNSSLEEIITDGRTGYLIENESVLELERCIVKILQFNKSEKFEFQTNCFKFADSLKKENRIDQLLNFYRNIISSFKAHSNGKKTSNYVD